MVPKSTAIRSALQVLCLILVGPVITQFAGEDNSRNCTADEIIAHSSGISYQTRNTTGSFSFPGFSRTGEPSSSWTWSTGVQNVYNKSRFWYQQPVWLDTHGVDLASDGLGFQMCYLSMLNQPQSVQERGHGDSGDCMMFFSKECVADWKVALGNQALSYIQNNSTGSNSTSNPCHDLRFLTPDSCKGFPGSTRISSLIPTPGRKCPLGLGSPDYDAVILTAYMPEKNDSTDTLTYDKMTTAIVPVFALAWAETAQGGWSDSRIMCLSTPNITEGSRKATGVPSASVKLELNFLVFFGGLMLLVITC